MTPDDELTEVFDRGLRDGLDALTRRELELFRIQEFILGYEMGGLSGYFYNQLPDLDRILSAVAAMRRHGLAELAALVGEAAGLFAGYDDTDLPNTWGDVLERYDPADRLDVLEERIRTLDNYGLAGMDRP
jgi:hypothetical protein